MAKGSSTRKVVDEDYIEALIALDVKQDQEARKYRIWHLYFKGKRKSNYRKGALNSKKAIEAELQDCENDIRCVEDEWAGKSDRPRSPFGDYSGALRKLRSKRNALKKELEVRQSRAIADKRTQSKIEN